MEYEPDGPTEDGGHDYTFEKLKEMDPFILDARFRHAYEGCQRTTLPKVDIPRTNGAVSESDFKNALKVFLESHPYKREYWPDMRLDDAKKAYKRRSSLKATRPAFESFNQVVRRVSLQIGHNFEQELKRLLNKYRDIDHEMQRELRTLKRLLGE